MHGDLHPGNILVTRDATRDPAVCFLDAGICVELGAKEHVHLVRVLSALMRHDGDAAGRLLCKGMDGARASPRGSSATSGPRRSGGGGPARGVLFISLASAGDAIAARRRNFADFADFNAIEQRLLREQRRGDGVETPRHRADAATETTS